MTPLVTQGFIWVSHCRGHKLGVNVGILLQLLGGSDLLLDGMEDGSLNLFEEVGSSELIVLA